MYREPIVTGRKPRLKSTVWIRRKKETSNHKRMKKQEFKNMRKGLQTWDNFKCSNIGIIGVPEGEEEEQKLENLFEQTIKGNFPNLNEKLLIESLSG